LSGIIKVVSHLLDNGIKACDVDTVQKLLFPCFTCQYRENGG